MIKLYPLYRWLWICQFSIGVFCVHHVWETEFEVGIICSLNVI
jgi:hypothetical protein